MNYDDIKCSSEASAGWAAPRSNTLVLDNGTGVIKCGFAGDEFPSAFPCVVGRAMKHMHDAWTPGEDALVGSACLGSRQQLQTSCPISNGIVRDWGDMNKVWDHAFHDQLGIKPSELREFKVLLTEPASNPAAVKRQSLEAIFEQHGFAACNMQQTAPLTLYAQGLVSGLVLESGEALTHAVPVVEGVIFPHAIKRGGVAGRQVTTHLVDLLLRRGHAINKTEGDSMQTMKEALCYVTLDLTREAKLAKETTYLTKHYSLPDGSVIRIGQERFLAPEALFNPTLVDVEGPGIAQMAFNAIQEMDMDNRRCLYEHVVLSGGNTMLPGLPTRLCKELRQLYLDHVLKGDVRGLERLCLRLMDPPNRKHLVFLGGAVLADIMKDQDGFWISKQEYEECPHRALQRCGAV